MPPTALAPTPRRFHVMAVAVGLVTAVASTWPMATRLHDHVLDGARFAFPDDPATWAAQNQGADVVDTVWVLNWDLHALATSPRHLFEANRFYPAPLALARGEHLFATALLGVPGKLAGGPVLVHQTVLLLCALLNVWAAAYLVVRWGGSTRGALVAGVLYAVSPFHQSQLSHLQSLGTAGFPLMLLALERISATGRGRWTALGAGALGAQMLAGQHLALFALVVWTLGAVIAVATSRAGRLRVLAALILATAGAAVVVVPFALPYLQLAGPGMPGDDLGPGAGRPLARYLFGRATRTAAPIPPAAWLLAGLGGLALVRQRASGGVRLAILVAIGVAGAFLSAGSREPQVASLYASAAPLLSALGMLDAPSRWALLPYLSLALLGGLGATVLDRSLPRSGFLLAALLAGVVLAGSWRPPLPLRSLGAQAPPAYDFLARCGGGDPLLELPAPTPLTEFHEAEREYLSTFHWLPLLNGWARQPPPRYRELMDIARQLPEGTALHELRAKTGIRWLLAHCDAGPRRPHLLCQPLAARLGDRAWEFGDMRLYDLGAVPALPRAWSPRPTPAPGCS